jgi:hypothetical protein
MPIALMASVFASLLALIEIDLIKQIKSQKLPIGF